MEHVPATELLPWTIGLHRGRSRALAARAHAAVAPLPHQSLEARGLRDVRGPGGSRRRSARGRGRLSDDRIGQTPLPAAADQSVQELLQFRGWRYQTFPDRSNNYTYGQLDFSTVIDGQALPIALDELPEREQAARHRPRHERADVASARIHRRARDHVERAVLKRGQRGRARVDRVAVLVTSADLEPLRQRARSETCVYLVQGGVVSSRGCHSAESLDRQRLQQLLNATAPARGADRSLGRVMHDARSTTFNAASIRAGPTGCW